MKVSVHLPLAVPAITARYTAGNPTVSNASLMPSSPPGYTPAALNITWTYLGER